MTHDELFDDLKTTDEEYRDRELELQRLTACYKYASGDDKKVIWAVLNKYVPFLSAEGLI